MVIPLLHMASIHGHVSVVRRLVMSHECRKDLLNKSRKTAIQEAGYLEKMTILKLKKAKRKKETFEMAMDEAKTNEERRDLFEPNRKAIQEYRDLDELVKKYQEIRRFINDPVPIDLSRFDMIYEEFNAFDGSWENGTGFKAFYDKKWANGSFKMRWELVLDFKKMGNDFNQIYRHLSEKASLNDPNEWAWALIYVYTMDSLLYSRMNMDLLSDAKWTPFKSYPNALDGALRALQHGLNGFKRDPRISIDPGTLLYRFSLMCDDHIRILKRAIGKKITLKSFTSTTRDPITYVDVIEKESHNVIFEIETINPNGCYAILEFSANPDEDEVLLDRTTAFQVKSVKNYPGCTDIWIIGLKIDFSDESTKMWDKLSLDEKVPQILELADLMDASIDLRPGQTIEDLVLDGDSVAFNERKKITAV